MPELTPGWSSPKRTSEPSTTAVTRANCKIWANIPSSNTDHDSFIDLIIPGIVDTAEKYMGRALITQSYKRACDRWPGGELDWWDLWHTTRTRGEDAYLELPYGAPLQSITSVTTYDTDDTSTSITVDDYFYVDTNAEPGRLCLRSGQSFPVDTREWNRIEIVYVCGYGDAATNVPEGIRSGLYKAVAWQIEHRGDCDAGSWFTKSGAITELAHWRIENIW